MPTNTQHLFLFLFSRSFHPFIQDGVPLINSRSSFSVHTYIQHEHTYTETSFVTCAVPTCTRQNIDRWPLLRVLLSLSVPHLPHTTPRPRPGHTVASADRHETFLGTPVRCSKSFVATFECRGLTPHRNLHGIETSRREAHTSEAASSKACVTTSIVIVLSALPHAARRGNSGRYLLAIDSLDTSQTEPK